MKKPAAKFIFFAFVLALLNFFLTQQRQFNEVSHHLRTFAPAPTYTQAKLEIEGLVDFEDNFISRLCCREEVERVTDRADEYLESELEFHIFIQEGRSSVMVRAANQNRSRQAESLVNRVESLRSEVNTFNRNLAIFMGLVLVGYFGYLRFFHKIE